MIRQKNMSKSDKKKPDKKPVTKSKPPQNQHTSPLDRFYKWKYVGYEKCQKAFTEQKGLKFYIAQALDIDRVTLDDWLKADEKLMNMYKESVKNTDDFVNCKMMELIGGVTMKDYNPITGEVGVYEKEPNIKAIETYHKLKGNLIQKTENQNQNMNVNVDVSRDLETLSIEQIMIELEKLKGNEK